MRRPRRSVCWRWRALAACDTTPTAKSGILSDYSKLQPDPKIEGQLSYRNPSKKVTASKKFLIDPVVVQLAPNAKGKTIDPGDLKALTDFFRNEAVKALSKRYQVVSKPGPGVLYPCSAHRYRSHQHVAEYSSRNQVDRRRPRWCLDGS